LKRDAKASAEVEIAEDVMQWMRTHTMRDLKEIALEMEREGEDARDVWDFIDQLHEITQDTGKTHQETIKSPQEAPAHA